MEWSHGRWALDLLLGISPARSLLAVAATYLALWTVSACSDDTAGAGAGSGGGAGSGAGGNGTSGAGGSSPGGSQTKLADFGVEVPESVASNCLAYAKAACGFIARCAPSDFAQSYLDAPDCERQAQDACRQIALPGVNADAANYISCSSPFATTACDDKSVQAATQHFRDCLASSPGSLSDGAPCRTNAQCAGGLCKAEVKVQAGHEVRAELQSLIECGSCVSVPLTGKQGEPCGNPEATGKPCEDGLVCVEGNCRQPLSEGEACPGLVGDKCAAGLFCASQDGKQACAKTQPLGGACVFDQACGEAAFCGPGGACAPRKPQGSPCAKDSFGRDCEPGLFCIVGVCSTRPPEGGNACEQPIDCAQADDFTCEEGVCTRRAVKQFGEPCKGSSAHCAAGLYCDEGKGGSGTCKRDPGEGEPCRLNDQGNGTSLRCGPGLYCDGKACVANKAVACP